MERKRIGFIGCGNMAKAMMQGMIRAGAARASEITASDVYREGLEQTRVQLGIEVTMDNTELVTRSDIIFLAVKPNVLETVIRGIIPVVTDDKLIISIAAGQTIGRIEDAFGKPVRLIRLMPNTPALAGEGMTGATANERVSEENLQDALRLLKAFGQAEVVPEKLMDAVVAVSGSGPAYVFIFIEAMADAAVLEGMPRAQAYEFAAQTVLGSARLMLETGKHPGELKDMVCSPGGTTINAVAALEECGFRNAVVQAMKCCADRSRMLGKKS